MHSNCWGCNYISNCCSVLIGRVTPQSKSINIFSLISPDFAVLLSDEASDLLMRSMGYALVTATIIASTPVQILLLCFFVGWQASAVPPTYTWRNSRSSLKWGEGPCFLHHCLPPPPPPPPHHWQQVCVNTSIKLDSWPAGSDKRKERCLNREGRMMCILGATGKPPPS